MKFIDMIVDYILNTNDKKGSTTKNAPTPVYLPCSELFGNLSSNNSECLIYDYVNADFKPENTITL